jgi:hypothetical protein
VPLKYGDLPIHYHILGVVCSKNRSTTIHNFFQIDARYFFRRRKLNCIARMGSGRDDDIIITYLRARVNKGRQEGEGTDKGGGYLPASEYHGHTST